MLTLAMPAAPARSGAASPRWLKAVAVSLALHAVLVLVLRPSSGGQPTTAESPALVARLIAVTTPGPWVREAATAAHALQAPLEPTTPTAPSATAGDRGVIPASTTKDLALLAAIPAPKAAARGLPLERRERIGEGNPTPPTAAPQYLGPAGLDSPPRPLTDIEPAYPADADRREGTVVLRLLISEEGGVDGVSVVRSFPKGLFDAAAMEAFAAAKFEPARLRGAPVASQWLVEVQFTPINRGPAVSGRSF
jgi:protein TonB